MADLGDLMRPADQFRLALYPRALYSVLLGRWAAANGYICDGRPDWRELRAAGLVDKQTGSLLEALTDRYDVGGNCST